MQKYIDLLEALASLKPLCNEGGFKENWGNMTFAGQCCPDFFTILKKVEEVFVEHGQIEKLSLDINNSTTSWTEVYDLAAAKNPSHYNWRLSFNKKPLVDEISASGESTNIYLEQANLIRELSDFNVFDENSPLSSDKEQIIFVNDLERAFEGPKLHFYPSSIPASFPDKVTQLNLPAFDKLKDFVRFSTSYKAALDLQKYELSKGEFGSPLAKKMLTISSAVFAAAICDEFSDETIVISGLRRIEVVLGDKTRDYSYQYHRDLVSLISWLYEESTATRKKLFADRISLEMKEGGDLMAALQENLTKALTQAQERYNYVVMERSDAYTKELKDLLKDFRAQSDLYAVKIRGLVGNLLRDLLGGIILVGFTLFSKFVDSTSAPNYKLIDKVFTGLAIYYGLSLVIQAIVDMADVIVTGKEVSYWRETTKNYMNEEHFRQHKNKSLGGRRVSFWILYGIIAILYILIIKMCINYPDILSSIIEGYKKPPVLTN